MDTAARSEMAKEVELLFPTGKVVVLNKKDYTILPYGFGKFPKVMASLSKLADVTQLDTTGQTEDAIIKMMFLTGGEEIMDLCALALDQPRKFLDTIPADEGVQLALAILEVNRDFFIARLQPQVVKIVAKLSELAGAASSLASSNTDTEKKT